MGRLASGFFFFFHDGIRIGSFGGLRAYGAGRFAAARVFSPPSERVAFQGVHPLNLSILVSGGKEINGDSPSNCE